ncbi:energy transducer TonB [Rhodanobacter sp. C06]|uniref:energy transducer TonB n=1 Tax=Rhodanobacter sp. C06 TaxID=1945854 RepID=UPI0009851307|nr:energy transducer TonB [Rhodanobacter sp. C06]OOG48170.1 energy transducer TonB [Rhodanobacter sp. C06]
MDTRYTHIARRRVRGAVRPVAIAIIAIVAALAAAAWLLIVRPYQQQMQLDNGGVPAVAAAGKTPAEAAPANVQAMDVNQLLTEASKALKDQRYLAPAGNNAFEFYLRVLAKQPGNPVATSALRETFPYAASDAEQAVNSRDFNEAQREIDLLAKADPANYTLTILRSKLDAQRKLASQQQQQAEDQQKAAQLAVQKAATEKQEAAKQAEQQQAQLAAEQAKAKQQHTEQQQTAAQATAQPAPTAVAAAESSDAVLLKGANPNYPTAALRAGQSGWVVVGFTVTPEGRTSDVHVVDAQPRHVFDRSAMEAVSRYRFKPAMRGGTAVASTKQQKIEFSTGR